MKRVLFVGLSALLVLAGCASALAAKAKPHYAALGKAHTVSYSAQSDPAGARPGEETLAVRPLVVNGKIVAWTTGAIHEITPHTFTVRSAVRVNDALPADQHEHWVWQKGPWLLVDQGGKYKALRLPDFDPSVSDVAWYRDYAAYCGLSPSGKNLYAVVARVASRRAVLSKKLEAWNPEEHPSPACEAVTWDRDPPRVSFALTGGTAVSFDVVGSSATPVKVVP